MRREWITFLRVYVLPPSQPLGSDVRGVLKKFRSAKAKISLRESLANFKIFDPAKKAKNLPKIEKNSNLKVDALPYSSTDSTRFYSEYYLGIPLSIAGIKNYFG